MTEMFGEAWSPMSVPDLAPDDDDDDRILDSVVLGLMKVIMVVLTFMESMTGIKKADEWEHSFA